MEIQRLRATIKSLNLEQLEQLDRLGLASALTGRPAHPVWKPWPGQQTKAYDSEADELFYGGAAGGGKSDLILGLALTQHKHSLILRRVASYLKPLSARLKEIAGSANWRSLGHGGSFILDNGGMIELGGCEHEKDKENYQGSPHDLICVGKGTPVLLPNGIYKPVEQLQVGDHVQTLEGPKRVIQKHPPQHKPSVLVEVLDDKGNVLDSQVQSCNHQVLTEAGWISSDDLLSASDREYPLGGRLLLYSTLCALSERRSPTRESSKRLSSVCSPPRQGVIGSSYQPSQRPSTSDFWEAWSAFWGKRCRSFGTGFLSSLDGNVADTLSTLQIVLVANNPGRLLSSVDPYTSACLSTPSSPHPSCSYASSIYRSCDRSSAPSQETKAPTSLCRLLSWWVSPPKPILLPPILCCDSHGKVSYASKAIWRLENGYAKSSRNNVTTSPPYPNYRSFVTMPSPLATLLRVVWTFPLTFAYGDEHARSESSPLSCPGDCWSYIHQRDGLLRSAVGQSPCVKDVQVYLLQQARLEEPTPTYYASGARHSIPKHTVHHTEYPHPYTKGIRCTRGQLASYSFRVTPLGVKEVYDIAVEDVNHYITGKGIVNKNCFDEVSHFTRTQYQFIIGWNRSADENQRCRIICCGNPPTTPEGRWVVEEWAPWLDETFGDPAEPGELRWYSTIDGKTVWRRSGEPFLHDGEWITPKSRTFIPARLSDNPVLLATDYGARLQALPEPYRSMMLYGDMNAGQDDAPRQVIPSAWVKLAQQRWTDNPPEGFSLSCLGVDIARGGKDKTVIAPRFGHWINRLVKIPGEQTPDGPKAAARIDSVYDGKAQINIDISGGFGGSPYDILREKYGNIVNGINNAEATTFKDATGRLTFINVRAASYWSLREALDPALGVGLALPPDPELQADLCAPTYELLGSGIKVESKDHIIARLGRSPDCGDAVVLAWWQVKKKKLWIA